MFVMDTRDEKQLIVDTVHSFQQEKGKRANRSSVRDAMMDVPAGASAGSRNTCVLLCLPSPL